MTKMYPKNIVLAGVMFLSLLSPLWASTMVLSEQAGWQDTSDNPQGQYLLAVSKLKQAIVSGDADQVQQEMASLKQQFPNLAGADFDAFQEAELLYADGKWKKAVKRYNSFLQLWPDSIFYQAAMERLYSIGAAYLGGQKKKALGFLKLPAWDDGEKVIRSVSDRAGDAPLARRALITLAESQEKREEFLDAYQTWSEIYDRWPTNESGRDALYRMARSLHAAYTSPHFDPTVLKSALSYYEDFQQRYAKHAQTLGVADSIDTAKEQQAYKKFFVGMYYERTDQHYAAEMYYQSVLKTWPNSLAASMATERLTLLESGQTTVPQTARRRAFDAGNTFLDNWFGLTHVMDLPMSEETRKPITESVETENDD